MGAGGKAGMGMEARMGMGGGREGGREVEFSSVFFLSLHFAECLRRPFTFV